MTSRFTLPGMLLAALAVVGFAACEPPEDEPNNNAQWERSGPSWEGEPQDQPAVVAPSDDTVPTGQWKADPTLSPTGTTLIPDASGHGYQIVDEVCGAPEHPDYNGRFLTSMFRDIAFNGSETLAYLVDGSHLWVLDISLDEPERVAIEKLEGHPIALHWTPERIWVASLDSGLRGYGLDAAGLPVVTDVVSTLTEYPRVMDVAGADGALFAALGFDGLAMVELDGGTPGAVTTLAATPYAASVTVTEDRVVVAACERIWSYFLDADEDGDLMLAYETDFSVPIGSAKDATLVDDILYVSVGEALLAYRLGDTVMYIGFYSDDADGFYANGTVAGEQHLYLAAGDESVRSLDITDMPLSDGVPASEVEADPGLAQSVQTGTGNVTNEIETVEQIETAQTFSGDPIAVGLAGDRLFALGNFRYLGERTVDVFNVSIPAWLRHAGAYVEPNLAVGVSKMGQDIVVHGADGLHQLVDTANPHAPTVAADFIHDGEVRGSLNEGTDLYLYGHGPVVRARQQGSHIALDSFASQAMDARSLALSPTRAYIADGVASGIRTVDRQTQADVGVTSASDAFLGDAVLALGGDRLLAYDRILGEVHVFDVSGELPVQQSSIAVGLCEAYHLEDFYSVEVEVEARFLETPDGGHALLCPRQASGAAEVIFLAVEEGGAAAVSSRTSLPARGFTDVVLSEDRMVLVSFDHERYTSTVATCSRESGAIIAETSFSGRGNAVVSSRDSLWVVDGDFGLRVFDRELTPLTAQPMGL